MNINFPHSILQISSPAQRGLTWSSAVGTGLVARHVSQLGDDGAGQFLQPAVLEVELVSPERRVQGLLLTVLQH